MASRGQTVLQLNYYLLRTDLVLDAWNRVRQQFLPKGAYNPRKHTDNSSTKRTSWPCDRAVQKCSAADVFIVSKVSQHLNSSELTVTVCRRDTFWEDSEARARACYTRMKTAFQARQAEQKAQHWYSDAHNSVSTVAGDCMKVRWHTKQVIQAGHTRHHFFH